MNVPSEFENLIKLLILGDVSVGKSNFLFRFIENQFIDNHLPTVGFDYKSQIITLPDKTVVKLQIWDTVGQEKFMAINKSLLAKVHGIILIYDITDQDSFDHIDIEDKRVISEDEGNKLAVENNISFVEASAKENINIKETFIKITEEVMNNVHRKSVHFNDNEILINAQKRQSFSYQKNKQSRKCLKCC